MKFKRANAVLGLLSILFLLVHIGCSTFLYITMSYIPAFKLTAVPVMVLGCIHAVIGMSEVFLLGDGTRLDLYPGFNKETIIQRISAALIFPLLIMHLKTFEVLKATSEKGIWLPFIMVVLCQILFYGAVLAHVSVSFSKALITLGILTSEKQQKTLDRAACIICTLVFALAVFAVVKGEIVMFVMTGGAK